MHAGKLHLASSLDKPHPSSECGDGSTRFAWLLVLAALFIALFAGCAR